MARASSTRGKRKPKLHDEAEAFAALINMCFKDSMSPLDAHADDGCEEVPGELQTALRGRSSLRNRTQTRWVSSLSGPTSATNDRILSH